MTEIIFGNSISQWGVAFLITFLSMLLIQFAKKAAIRQLGVMSGDKNKSLRDMGLSVLSATHVLFSFIISLYAGLLFVNLSKRDSNIIYHIAFIASIIQIGVWVDVAFTFWLAGYQRYKRESDAGSITSTGVVGFAARIILWLMIALLILENLAINITALVASLGIGGIAVALAVQNILGDVFASLSIILDKPFVVGDFIVIDTAMGTVEHIGLKTTRLRSLSGEQVIISNANLLKERISNHKRMYERRVQFSIGLIYQTAEEDLKEVPTLIRTIVESQSDIRFDRAHFKEYTPSALNFEIVYFVLNPDYNIYMDIQQAINLSIFSAFAQKGIQFAHPVHTVYMAENPA